MLKSQVHKDLMKGANREFKTVGACRNGEEGARMAVDVCLRLTFGAVPSRTPTVPSLFLLPSDRLAQA